MPTTTQKDKVSQELEPVIAAFKANLSPIPEPQQFNHCVDVFAEWQRNYCYIKQKYKVADEEREQYFDVGVARLKYNGEDNFDLGLFSAQWQMVSALDVRRYFYGRSEKGTFDGAGVSGDLSR